MKDLNAQIKFGTDGWRGVVGDTFTFDNVKAVSSAIAKYYNSRYPEESKSFVVGYDNRFLSEEFAASVAGVLSGAGIQVFLSDRAVPTPCVSLAVKENKAIAGVMITASHNPYQYNGIKIKTSSGGAAGVEVTSEVEKLLFPYEEKHEGKAAGIRTVNLIDGYIKFLRSYVDIKLLNKSRFKVLVDIMHGSGGRLFSAILKDSGMKCEVTRDERNASFGGIQPEPIPVNLRGSMLRMKKEKFNICLVLDGDADRIAAIEPGGGFVSPQKILGLLALHLKEDRKMSGALVKTICGSSMLDEMAKKLGIELIETPVGFKYISNIMDSGDIMVGGEEAGGMGFRDYIPERDGTLAGLLLLEMMCHRKQPFDELIKDMERRFGRYFYVKDSIEIERIGSFSVDSIKGEENILNRKVAEVKDYDGVKFIFSDRSWLMVRGSGTEPIVRVYAEALSERRAARLLDFGKSLVKNNIKR